MFPRGQWDLDIAWSRAEIGKKKGREKKSTEGVRGGEEETERREEEKDGRGRGDKNQKRRSSCLGRKEFCHAEVFGLTERNPLALYVERSLTNSILRLVQRKSLEPRGMRLALSGTPHTLVPDASVKQRQRGQWPAGHLCWVVCCCFRRLDTS